MMRWMILAGCVACEPELCETDLESYCATRPPGLPDPTCPKEDAGLACRTEIVPATCDGLTVYLCPADNTTAILYLYQFQGDLAAIATQPCPDPTGDQAPSCRSQGGWAIHGRASDEVVACTRATAMGQCYE